MMIVRPRMLLALIAAIAATPLDAQSTFDQVDAIIGTGGEGHTFPGAVAPFGMVQFSPDTDTGCVIRTCYSHAAGYRYEDPTIQGFSLTHFSGAGHSDLGDFLMMPVSGDTVPLEPGDPVKPGTGYRSRYNHAAEIAQPGFYSVMLRDRGVTRNLQPAPGSVSRATSPGRSRMRCILSSICAVRFTTIPARYCGRRSGCAPMAP
jgi:putative alpha-1,2-mannosidase